MEKPIQAGYTPWILWYEDRFDLECPRQVEAEGEELLQGLVALWTHHLQESVHENMGGGFNAFNLWLVIEKTSIKIPGDSEGLGKIKEWIFEGGTAPTEMGGKLLIKLAAAHENLLRKGKSGEILVNLAERRADHRDFEKSLDILTE